MISSDSTTVRRWSWTAWLALLGVALSAYLIGRSIYSKLTTPWPLSPWESAIILGADRAAHGQQVYFFHKDGPTTHLYGVLTTYANVPIFFLTGPNLYSPRAIALGSSLLLAIGFAWVFARRDGWLIQAIIIVLVLSALYRARGAYVESRPDAVSVLFAFASLCLLFRGHAERRWLFTLIGCVAIMIGFGFKQTAVVVCVVPMLAILSDRKMRSASQLFRAILPIAVAGAGIICLKKFWPAAAFYMLDGPRLYELRIETWPTVLLSMLASSFLFPIALLAYLSNPSLIEDSKKGYVRWALMSCLVLIPACTVFAAKREGQNNSFLLAYVAIQAFVALVIPGLLRTASENGPLLQRMIVTTFLGLLIPAEMLSLPANEPFTTRHASQGGPGYAQIIARVRELDGKVVSPDDPTIALFAKGFSGLSLETELGAVGRQFVPKAMLQEITSAQWFVGVAATWTQQQKLDLPAMGFSQVDDPVFRKTRYTLWHRETALPATKPILEH